MKDREKHIFNFKLKGKTIVIIDWANVYGWFEKLKWKIDLKKLYDYLKSYPEIYDIRFYFGIEDGNKKSEEFNNKVKQIGFNVINKKVKYVPFYLEKQKHLKILLNYLKETLDEIDSLIYQDWEIIYETEFIRKIMGLRFLRRKCNFDIEITLDVIKNLGNFNSLILFSGDGDYAPLVKELIDNDKQVILVFGKDCKGKEYDVFKTKLYQCNIENLRYFIQQ